MKREAAKKADYFQVFFQHSDYFIICTLIGGNGKRDFLSSRGAELTTVDIAMLDAGTCTGGF